MTGPPGTPARHPSRFRESGVKARHLRAHVVIVAWLALALVAAVWQDALPVGRWLAVHMFLLGAVSTAVLVWTEHFAVALLHARLPGARWSDARLAGANLAVAGLLAGVWTAVPALTAAAALLLVAVSVAQLVMLVRLGRGSLGGRLKPVVAYYRAATLALVAGAVLGWPLASGTAGADRYAGLRLAHVHVTLLGWIGLPVLGTLFMLWPTVVGVRMREESTRAARRTLWLSGGGLAVAVAGQAHGLRWAGAAGLAGYLAGVALAARLFARTVRGRQGRPPVSAAAMAMLAAAVGWLVVGAGADLALLATRPVADVRPAFDTLVPLLLVGFVGQVLMGALTYLLPVVLSRGPAERAAVRRLSEAAWPVRTAALNLGVALLVLPVPAPLGTVASLLVAAAWCAFLVSAGYALARGGGLLKDGPSWPAPAGAAGGAALVMAAALMAGSGPDGAPPSAGRNGGGTAHPAAVRTVDVTLKDMRITPARIEAAKGTELRLKVTNKDDQRHDLRIADGPATPALGRGDSHTLALGTVTENRKAWCTVPGHRAAGMSMDIVTRTRPEGKEQADGASGHGGHTSVSTPGGPDLSAAFSHGWKPRPAALEPAPGKKTHRVELRARHRTVEVAPGVRRKRWTFGGTAPGPTLRGKVGDVFEITLVNDERGMGHGIDFHPGALAPDRPMRTLGPGECLTYRFRAEKAGAWLYHCSTAPMLQHIGNGMFGAVIIDPPGLPKVDHEYVLVSSELYLGTPGSAAQLARMRAGTPDAWAFNGVAAQYAKAPLTARAGDRVRFWVVAAGPRDGLAFHLVGTVFDTVYKEGGYLLKPDDPGGSQALDLAPAQGGFVETTFPEAGHYSFVDHDMAHAESGASGTVAVKK